MSSIKHLSFPVRRQIARLNGHIPEDFEPREWIVNTPIGPHPVPPSVQALLAVRWPEGHVLYRDDDLGWETNLPCGDEVPEHLIGPKAAWYGVGWDEGQWFLVVDLSEGGEDPYTYWVDHEGDERRPAAVRLSQRLKGLAFRIEEGPGAPAEEYAFGRLCAAGDLAAVEAGLTAGEPIGPIGESGVTPLHFAALTCASPEVVARLIAAGADVEARLTDTVEPMWRYIDMDLLPRQFEPGATPLHLALVGLDPLLYRKTPQVVDVIRLLLEAGADPDTPHPSDGKRPLPNLIFFRGDQYFAAARLLVAAGANPNETHDLEVAPIVGAMYHGADAVALLLEAGVDPCTPLNRSGETALHQVARGASDEVIALLLAAASDVDVADEHGITPLHKAVTIRSPRIAKAFLDAGADPSRELTDPNRLRHGLTARTPAGIARELDNEAVMPLFD